MKIQNSDTIAQPSVGAPSALQRDSLAAFHDVSPSARICVTLDGVLQLNGVTAELRAVTAELQRLKSVNGTVYYYRGASGTKTHPTAGIVFDLILNAQLTLMRISTPDFSEYYDLQGQSWPRNDNKRRERQHASINKRTHRLWLQGLALGFALGLLICAVRVPAYLDARDMIKNGVVTDAVVMNKRQWVENTPSRRQFLHDMLTYEFTDPSGAKHFSEVDVEPSDLQNNLPGGFVRVVYKAHQPSANQQLAHYERLASWQDTAFVALLAAAAVCVIFGIVGLLVKKKLLKGL